MGWEDPLEKGMSTHLSILAWSIPRTEELAGYSPWGHKELDTTEQFSLSKKITSSIIKLMNFFWRLSKKYGQSEKIDTI